MNVCFQAPSDETRSYSFALLAIIIFVPMLVILTSVRKTLSFHGLNLIHAHVNKAAQFLEFVPVRRFVQFDPRKILHRNSEINRRTGLNWNELEELTSPIENIIIIEKASCYSDSTSLKTPQ